MRSSDKNPVAPNPPWSLALTVASPSARGTATNLWTSRPHTQGRVENDATEADDG